MTTEIIVNQNTTGKVAALFHKRTVAELADVEMMNVDGGTTAVCAAAVASSGYCGLVASGLVVAGAFFWGGFAVGFVSGFYSADNQMVE